MVRAGVVDHPCEWPDCGYHEIQNPRQRYAIINRQKLSELALVGGRNSLRESHAGWLHEMLPVQGKGREEKWSTSIAAGGENFVTRIKELLGAKATGRRIINGSYASVLREPSSSYNGDFMPENAILRAKNMHYWRIYPDDTMS